MCINDVELPKYSLKEELMNAISHGLGAIFGIVALVLMLIKTIPSKDVFSIISVSIYGISLIILFTISCLYHSLARNKGKKVLRIMDHNMIYILVSGTYTPYTLIAMQNENIWNLGKGTVAYIMLITVWICCIVGIIFNSINIKKYAPLSMTCYIVSGWIIILAFFPLWNIIGATSVLLLLGGGIAYTIGSVLYIVGKKKKYMHSVFHIFVLIGAVMMFVSIYCYVL